jgi:hypothetical protein
MVSCNYDARHADLDTPYSQKTDQVCPLPIMDPVSLNDALLGMINSTLLMHYPKGYGQPLQLELKDLDKLRRWQNRTVMTIGSPATAKVYQKEIIKLVARYPYLMHSVLALTTKHDRYLAPDMHGDPQRKALEYFHYGKAAALFNRKLSHKDELTMESEHDALWGTAVFLGSLASGTLDGESSDEVWPMKDGTSGEALSWLRIHEGLRVLWYLSEPFAPGRMFNELVNSPDHSFMMTKLDPYIEPGIRGIPPDFVQLCGLNENSTMDNSPFQKAVRTLVPLMDLPWTGINRLKFMSFAAMMHPQFKQLLRDKDVAALVLLAWWYALVLRSQWYLSRRALLECRSICIYLGRKCPENAFVQKMLRWPRQKTGLLREEVEEDEDANPWTSSKSKWGAIVMMHPRG